MARRDSIQRINHIVSFLRRKPASFKEIQVHLEQKSMDDSFNYSISQKTFKRDLFLILDTLFIEIQFSHSLKKYAIVEDFDNEINTRIVEAYDTFNALKLANDISQYLFFEKRKAIGTEHLSTILFSIKNKKMLRYSYQKYGEDEANKRLVLPLALKENKNRWYLIAIDNKDQQLKTFGLDRMNDVHVSDAGFDYPTNLVIEDIFKDSFGIINDEDYEAEEIILSFSKFQSKYIKSLPLHHSQEILFEDAQECRIKVFLQPTHDFLMEILSMASEVEVLEPEHVRNEIQAKIQKTLNKYK